MYYLFNLGQNCFRLDLRHALCNGDAGALAIDAISPFIVKIAGSLAGIGFIRPNNFKL
jgi:hypothetical protein